MPPPGVEVSALGGILNSGVGDSAVNQIKESVVVFCGDAGCATVVAAKTHSYCLWVGLSVFL